jgi:lysophospholipase L1-like esterase
VDLRIVYMGDSITVGQHCDPALRWTTLLDRLLAQRFTDRRVNVVTFNRGESGQTTRQGLERYPSDVQELEPHVLTLQFGMNDCNCWMTDRGLPRVSEAAFRANLVEMVGRACHFGARAVIMATNPCTLRSNVMPSGEIYETANARYSQIVREVAAEVGATLCDIRARFESLSQREMAEMVLPDLLHLSVRGNAMYADLIAPDVLAAVATVTSEAVAT